MSRRLILLVLAGLLGGCATVDCRAPQIHDDAETAPLLRAPDGLVVPESDPAMHIPPGPTEREDTPLRVRSNGTCLDTPPAFEAPAGEG